MVHKSFLSLVRKKKSFGKKKNSQTIVFMNNYFYDYTI